jgi:uncharacterized protein
MIIDIHTHVPSHRGPVPESEREVNTAWRPDRPVQANVSWDDYLGAMRPVDRACVFGIRMRGDPANVNDHVAAFVRAHPEKLVGFVSVHPEEAGALAELERGVHELGFKGLKLGPNYQGFDPLGKPAQQVYAACVRLGIPILFHQGTSPVRDAPLKYAHPLLMDEVAMAFPELRIVMAHMAHPWQADTFAVIRKHPHVYADVSAAFYRPWSAYSALRLATEWNVLGKLLFGTDYPVATPDETIAGLLAVNKVVEGTGLPRVPEDALQAIIHRDSLALLGIGD